MAGAQVELVLGPRDRDVEEPSLLLELLALLVVAGEKALLEARGYDDGELEALGVVHRDEGDGVGGDRLFRREAAVELDGLQEVGEALAPRAGRGRRR